MVLAMGALVLSGCGTKEKLTLADMVSQNPEMAKTIEEGLAELDAEGVSQSVNYKGNTVEVALKYDKVYKDSDVEILAKAFEDNGDIYESACAKAIAKIKKGAELEGVKIKVTVLNGDSEEIWSKVYKEE